MTYAPADLLAVREFLLSSTGLSGDAVGIVGDPEHASTGGYHEGNDDLARVGRLSTDYSKRESARDRPGTNAASALDIGDFRHGAVSLRTLSLGLVAACQRGDPRTADVREVIYTPDGRTVRRFDRLGIRSTGDSSHLIHTHISFFRDSEGRRARPDNVLGLLAELIEGDGMTPVEAAEAHNTHDRTYAILTMAPYGVATDVPIGDAIMAIGADVVAVKVAVGALATALAAGGGSVDAAVILARMDAIAEAESAAVARLHAELVSSRQEAQLLRERLAAALDPPGSG